MELTSLGCEKDPTSEPDLACHLLGVYQSLVLLECPLDLSALALFLPAPLSTHAALRPCSDATSHGLKRRAKRDVLLRPSTKRVCVSHEGGRHKEMLSPFKEVHGQVLADAEPWYKVAGLQLVDVGLLDAVLISHSSGMLGLPFLTKHPDFRGKVYASKATAEIGRMMMEELVQMHADFSQSHGRTEQKPPWLDPSIVASLPGHMRGSSSGRCFSNRANWQPLYSADDIRDCFTHVHKLRFGEEVDINGSLGVMPVSSGMGIGASNWVLAGAGQSVGYVAASLAAKSHAMPMDKTPLTKCRTLILSDLEPDKPASSTEALPVKTPEVSGAEHLGPLRQSSSGSGSSHRKASGSFSSVGARGVVKPDIEKEGKTGSGDPDGTLRNDATTDVVAEVAAACKAAIEAVRRGGSVLFPVSPSGVLLELLEELGVQLAAANLKHVPVHYISTAAEELLAYCNTIPEWLCRTRQEKLYAGESLFGYVDLVQEGRLRHSKAFSSPELQNVWQEPCIVFAAHFSLRMGPAVHLLHRWRQNPLCLLVLTERELEKDLLLAPYMPLAMQVLELRASLRLRSKEVVSLLQSLHPQVALVPDSLRGSLEGTRSATTKMLLGYKKGLPVHVPSLETEIEVDMSAQLALQVQPKLVKPKKVAAAPFQASFCFRDGKLSLHTTPSDTAVSSHDRWGQVNAGALSRALQERGISDVTSTADQERNSFVVEIRSPSRAWIELGPSISHVKANEPSLRHLIADAITSVLSKQSSLSQLGLS